VSEPGELFPKCATCGGRGSHPRPWGDAPCRDCGGSGVARPDGATYDPEQDGKRLATQHQRVFALMSDGQWRTLEEIASAVHGTTQSVSARLRDLRKTRFGEHEVERRRRSPGEAGLFEYRLRVNVNAS